MPRIKAKFNQKTKQEIYNRDKVCIISWEPITDYHHCFYGAIQSNYWPDRNNANQWVWLSQAIHYEIHHWVNWRWQELRKQCINYLNNL